VTTPPTQLDIFEHSRDVALRNAVINALQQRDAGAGARALTTLAAEYAGDPLLPAFSLVCKRLRSSISGPISREAAIAMLQETDGAITSAARAVFGKSAQAWLAPVWAELAAAIADYRFDPDNEALHAGPLLLRAERWAEAVKHIESIASWRRQPAPLTFMIQAQCRIDSFDSIWPLLTELAWMAPQRGQALAPELTLPELDGLLRGFDAEFEGDGLPEDFAWFPAWSLIVDNRLAEATRLAQSGADTQPERCTWIVLALLKLERQGRHAELVEGRRKLRETHPWLFTRYMQDR
jgi:hypothetical protein